VKSVVEDGGADAVVSVAAVVETVVATIVTAQQAKRMNGFIELPGYSFAIYSDSEKKVHQSWGGDDGNAELRTEEAAQKDAGADLNTAVVEDNTWGGTAPADDAWGAPAPAADDAWGAPAPAAEAPAEAEGRRGRDREPEEPDNTLTLDQYLAQQKDKTLAAVPKLEARKIESDELWKDAIALQKRDEDEDAYFVGKVHDFVTLARLYRSSS
jgi:hypothetical protein